MLFDYFSTVKGIIKIFIYKLLYFSRVKIDLSLKINSNFSISTKRKTFLEIGKKCRFRNNINIRIDDNGKVIVGNNTFFNDNVSINCQKKVMIGDNVSIGHNTIIIDHDHDYKNDMKDFVSEEIMIGNNVWIGANCIILKGSKIGDNTIIAAGTTVKGDYTNNSNHKKLIYNKKEIKEVEIC